MARFKLTIEYHGRPFVGWQRQTNGMSVQQALEEAIKEFSGEKVILHAAGRTDTGVHATGQVCHVDLEKETDASTVRDANAICTLPACRQRQYRTSSFGTHSCRDEQIRHSL